MIDFKARTIHAISWTFGSKVVSQIISFAIGIALARLLVPDDFGLLAMVMVIIGLGGILSEFGFGSALIHKKDVNQTHFSSVFWLNSIVGLLLTFLSIWLSAKIADFYNRSELDNIVLILSINFFISSLAMVPRTILSKDLRFREIVLADLIGMLLSGIVAIYLAVTGYGYWSLVAQRIVERISSSVMIWYFCKWKPSGIFNIAAIRELFSFSSNVFLTYNVRYISSQADKLLIGKFLTASSLGLYEKAYSMMLFPLQNVSQVVGQVMFPSLSQIQDDIGRVRDIYIRMIGAISLLTFPMMVGMFVVVDSFVYGVLGEKWTEIIPLFKIFCVVGIFVSIATVTGPVYLALGHAKLQLKVNLINQPLGIVGVIIGLQWGLHGVAIGYSVSVVLGVFITWYYAGRLIKLSVYKILLALLPTFLLSVMMGLAVWSFKLMFSFDGYLLSFIIQSVFGAAFYLGLVMIFRPHAFVDVSNIIVKKIES